MTSETAAHRDQRGDTTQEGVPEPPRSLVGEASSRPLVATIGEVLAGKYKVERLIGEGGMGLVVQAKHLTLDRDVALKLLSPRARENGEAAERFAREARAAAKIRSEHVGRVLDVETLPNGGPFIVMELLEGHDLSAELAQEHKLGVEQVVTYVLQACEAIAEAHAAGIVHRDLKPANLFLARTASGGTTVKVLDFGISKITRRETPDSSYEKALTSASAMLGSPLYMSPEQMRASGEVDKRTDIWSLGVILFEAVMGRSPFDATTIPMVCANVLSQPPPPLDEPGLPEGFDRVVLRCLEKEPEKRFRDLHHLARALAPFAPKQAKVSLEYIGNLRTPEGASSVSAALSLPPPSNEASLTITAWGQKPAAPAGRRWLPIALVSGVLALAVGIGVAALTRESPPSAPVAAAPPVAAPAATVGAEPALPSTGTPSVAAPDASAAGASSAAVDAPPADSAAIDLDEPAGTASAQVPAPRPRWQPPTKEKPRTAGFGGRE